MGSESESSVAYGTDLGKNEDHQCFARIHLRCLHDDHLALGLLSPILEPQTPLVSY